MNPWVVTTTLLLAVWIAGSGILGAHWALEWRWRKWRELGVVILYAATWAVWVPGWFVVASYRDKQRAKVNAEKWRDMMGKARKRGG